MKNVDPMILQTLHSPSTNYVLIKLLVLGYLNALVISITLPGCILVGSHRHSFVVVHHSSIHHSFN